MKEIDEIKENMKYAIKENNGWTVSRISDMLQYVLQEHGREQANKLVDEFDLNAKYGIKKHI